jgi:hypothetical protein
MTRLRLALAVVGFAAALLAVAAADRRVGWVAIALLAISVVLRLAQRRL